MVADRAVVSEIQNIDLDLTHGLTFAGQTVSGLYLPQAEVSVYQSLIRDYRQFAAGLVPIAYSIELDFTPQEFHLARFHAANARRLVAAQDWRKILDESYASLTALPGKVIWIPDTIDPPPK